MSQSTGNDNENASSKRLKYTISTKIPIGIGTYSSVYHAVDTSGCEYAIKCINVDKLPQQDLSKFLKELEISMKLSHPNIVRCKEIFRTATKWYIVTEYCKSGTLHDIMRNYLPVIG